MKKILLVGLLSSIPFLGYSQAVVNDPAMFGLTTTLITLLSKMISSTDAKDSAKEAKEINEKIQQAIDGIEVTQKVIDGIQKVGSIGYALGENAQDTIDTFNEISEIFKGSPMTNKTMEELTALDQIQGWQDYEAAKEKAIKSLTDFRTFDKKMQGRMDNLWNTVDLIEESILAFGGSVDPTYTQIKNSVRNIDKGNRLTAQVLSVLQGESALRQVNEELEIWHDRLQFLKIQERKKEESLARESFFDIDTEELKKALNLDSIKTIEITQDVDLNDLMGKNVNKKYKIK